MPHTMTTHLHTLYTPELNRLRAELAALDRLFALANLPAAEYLTCTELLNNCHAAIDALEKSVNLTHDYYLAACADRDATHTELRSALTRLRVLTEGSGTPSCLRTALTGLGSGALGALTYILCSIIFG